MIKVERTKLLEAVQKAARAIRKKSITQIGECVLIKVQDNMMYISGSSSFMSIKTWMDVDNTSGEQLAVVVNARMLINVLSQMTGSQVALSEKKKMLHLKCGNIKFDLTSIEADLWTELPNINSEYTFNLNGEVLECVHALKGKDYGNNLMSSIHMEIGEKDVEFIALDGFRISVRGQSESVQHELNLDGEFVKEALNLTNGEAKIEVCGDLVQIKNPGICIIGKATQGTYFNVNKFLYPEKMLIKFSLERKKILETLNSMLIVGDHILLELKDGVCKMSARHALGSMESAFNIKGAEDQQIQIGFNGRFLQEALKSIKPETISIEMRSDKEPIYIRGDGYTEILMPIMTVKQ